MAGAAKKAPVSVSLSEEIGDDLESIFSEAYKAAGLTLAQERSVGVLLTNADSHAAAYAARGGELITDIDATTLDKTQGILEDAVANGLSDNELADNLSYIYGDARADLIARTEAATAYNLGTVRALKDAGEEYVYVSDPDECGEEVCDVDGEIWTLEEAEAEPLGHPNCGRDFRPLTEDEIAEVQAEEAADTEEGFALSEARLARLEVLLEQKLSVGPYMGRAVESDYEEQFGTWDPDLHPKDEKGRWTGTASVSGADSKNLSHYLRSQEDETYAPPKLTTAHEKWQRDLDKKLSTGGMGGPERVALGKWTADNTRTGDFTKLMRSAPGVPVTVFRGVNYTGAKAFSNAKVGSVLRVPRELSTSRDSKIAMSFADVYHGGNNSIIADAPSTTFMRIRLADGVPIEKYAGDYRSEHEVVMKGGSRLQVTGIGKYSVPGKWGSARSVTVIEATQITGPGKRMSSKGTRYGVEEEPRVPAGSPEGGEWTSGGGGGGQGHLAEQGKHGVSGTAALLAYTESSFSINEALRRAPHDALGLLPFNRDDLKTVRALDASLKTNHLEKDTLLYRGMDETFAGTLKVGDIYTDKGFMSTSSDPAMTSKGRVVEISAPAGTRALDVVHHLGGHPAFDKGRASEKEILLSRGTSFRVTRVTPEKIYGTLLPWKRGRK